MGVVVVVDMSLLRVVAYCVFRVAYCVFMFQGGVEFFYLRFLDAIIVSFQFLVNKNYEKDYAKKHCPSRVCFGKRCVRVSEREE